MDTNPILYKSLVQLLAARAASHPQKEAILHLEDGERPGRRITYGELDASARNMPRI